MARITRKLRGTSATRRRKQWSARSAQVESLEPRRLLSTNAPPEISGAFEPTNLLQNGSFEAGPLLDSVHFYPDALVPGWQLPGGDPADDIHVFEGHYYRLLPPRLSWQRARSEARSQGGDLVSVGSQAEQDFLVQTFGEQAPRMWIGLSDQQREGQFQWANGEPLAFTNWAPGQPRQDGRRNSEDYVELNVAADAGGWNALPNSIGNWSIRGVLEFDPTSNDADLAKFLRGSDRWKQPHFELWKNTRWHASDGTTFVELDTFLTRFDAFYQDLNTVAQQDYSLSLDVRARGFRVAKPNSNSLEVWWDGQLVKTSSATDRTRWETIQFEVTATQPTTRLELREIADRGRPGGDGRGPLIDNIQLRAIQDPNDTIFRIDDADPIGTAVVGILATDPDADAITFAITDGDPNGDFTIDPMTGLITIAGALDAGQTPVYRLTVEATDGELVDSTVLTISLGADIVPPAVPTISSIQQDTGVALDGVTRDNTLLIAGTGDPGSSITLSELRLGELGTAITHRDGSWLVDATLLMLPDGDYSFAAVAEDDAGNQSAASDSFAVVVDTTPPSAPISFGIDDDTGGSSNDGITADMTLLFSGSSAPASAITIDEPTLGIIGTALADADGNWSLDASATILADGDYLFSATAEDLAGNRGPATLIPVTVDALAPARPTLDGVAEDTGLSDTDGITTDTSPSLFGRAEPHAVIAVSETFLGQLGTTQADALGDWSMGISSTWFATGPLTFTVTATDVAGNTSLDSSPFSVTVDTAPPTPPQLDLDPAFDSAPLGDQQTSFDSVTLTGMTDPGALVELLETAAVTTADASGAFAFAGLALALGANTFTARATDVAGNTADDSLSITRVDDGIDHMAPSLLVALANDTGDPSDGLSLDPTISGTVADESNFTLLLDFHVLRFFETYSLDVTDQVNPDGTFLLGTDLLEDLIGETVPFGFYTATLTAIDEFGNASTAVLSIGHLSPDGADVLQPQITLGLRNDTGPNPTDHFTTDPSISGSIVDDSGFTVGLEIFLHRTGEFFATDISAELDSSGAFVLDQTFLENLLGGPLPYGYYDITMFAEDDFANFNREFIRVGHEPPDGADVFGPTLSISLAQPIMVSSGERAATDPTIVGSAIDESNFTLALNVYVDAAGLDFDADVTSRVQPDGNFVLDLPFFESLVGGPLEFGDIVVTFTALDEFGNVTFDGLAYQLLDPAAEFVPPTLVAGLLNDTGFSDSDGITTDPTIAGTVTDASPFTLELDFLSDSGSFLTDVTDQVAVDGAFTLTPAFFASQLGGPLLDGNYVVTLTAIDDFGNESFANLEFILGDIQPTTILAIDDDTGTSSTDGVTRDTNLLIFGTAEPLSIVSLLASPWGLLGTTQTEVDGNWSIDARATSLSDGEYLLRADAELTGSGLLISSMAKSIEVDTRPPIPPQFELASSSDTGRLGDGETTLATVDLVGTAEPDSTLTFVATGQTTTADVDGSFLFTNVPLEFGLQVYAIESSDTAGNTSTAESMILRDFSLSLSESADFVSEATLPVTLGQQTGSRTISFDVDFQIDASDPGKLLEDTLLVYLVEPANPTRTILDRGEPGTALISLPGGRADYQPGLVNFDGTRVDIDVTSLAGRSEGLLLFQLINSDNDEGTSVTLRSITNVVRPEDVENPRFDRGRIVREPAGPLDLSQLTPSNDVALSLENIRFDAQTGRYAAELLARNLGPAIGRQAAVVFANLPAGVTLANASGLDASGSPYVNLRDAIMPGGLDRATSTSPLRLEFDNPGLLRFGLEPQVLVGGPNQAPTLAPIPPLTVFPGGYLETSLLAADPDGDAVTFSIRAGDGGLPSGRLQSDGQLVFTPTPDELGTYNFVVLATDGPAITEQPVTLTVAADSNTTTRISGAVLDTLGRSIPGIPVELGSQQTLTQADGSFMLELPNGFESDALFIRGEQFAGPEVFPFIAEKLPLLLGHGGFQQVNNLISRPIYLPALDVANGKTIDPTVNVRVTTPTIPGAEVFVAAGSLEDQQGNPFTGVLSITEVPVELTPAALPRDISPDLVVTIQPGEMVFTTPAPLTLPNRAGYLPDSELDLWSINPETGVFDLVGVGRVSTAGTVIETISGGIRNSSWHQFAATRLPADNPSDDDKNQDKKCDQCEDVGNPNSGGGGGSGGKQGGFDRSGPEDEAAPQPKDDEDEEPSGGASNRPLGPDKFFEGSMTFQTNPQSVGAVPRPHTEVAYHTGAVYKTHQLPSYQSLGANRGITLRYDSERADPRPIVHFGYSDTQSPLANSLLATQLTVKRGNFEQQTWGNSQTSGGLRPGERYFSIAAANGGRADAAIQADLRAQPSGVYQYDLSHRLGTVVSSLGNQFVGSGVMNSGELVHVNTIASEFGAGWGIAGLLELIENPAGKVLLVNGDGTELLFDPPVVSGQPYTSSPGDFSLLRKLADGTFERTHKDQTVQKFNAANQLSLVTDRHGNRTQFLYNGADQLVKIIDPVGLETVFAYTSGRVTKITDPTLRETVLEYDASGNLIRITDADGTERRFDYDAMHHLTVEVDKRGGREELSYDAFGRILDVLRKDGSAIQYQPVQTQGLYQPQDVIDPLDAPPTFVLPNATTSVVDANGNVTRRLLDQGGQLKSASDGVGPLPSVARDADNLIARQQDARGNQTFLQYDGRGNILRVADPISSAGHAAPLFPLPIYEVPNPDFLEVADFNGDQIPDVVTSSSPGKLALLFGDAVGFSSPREFAVSSSPTAATLADFNGDGRVDVATANDASNDVSVLLGDGTGNVTRVGELPVGTGPEHIVSADLDQDGNTDLVTANKNANTVSVLLGDGAGGFLPHVDYPTGDFPVWVVAADINLDGHVDVITANGTTSNQVSILFGNGDGTLQPHVEIDVQGTAASRVDVFDIDADAIPDLVVDAGRVATLLGKGDGTFAAETSFFFAGDPLLATIDDIDGDGSRELLFRDGNQLRVMVNDGQGFFVEQRAIDLPFNPWATTVADTDLDGDADLLLADVAGNRLDVVIGFGDGTFATDELPDPDIPVGSQPVSLELVDVNGDLIIDVVTVNLADGTASIALGSGDGSFAPATTLATGSQPTHLVSGDLDGDSHVDLVVTSQGDDSVTVHWGAGDGSFPTSTTLAAGAGAFQTALGDLNGDLLLDLAVTNKDGAVGLGGGSFSVITNQGARSFALLAERNLTFSPQAIGLADLNHDSRLDLVIGNAPLSFDTSASVLLGVGDGTFGAEVTYGIGNGSLFPPSPTDLQLVDVNGNGLIDIVIGDRAADSLVVLRNDGAGTFTKTNTLQAGDAESLAVGDLDQNGNLDIAVTDGTGDRITLLLGQDNGTYQRSEFSVGDHPSDVQLADLDLDGDLDLVTSNASAGSFSVRLNSTAGAARLVPPTPPGGAPSEPNIAPKEYAYEPTFNRMTRSVDELGNEVLFEIDAATGSVLSVTEVIGARGGGDDLVTQLTYTARGLVDTVVDPLGRITKHDYDALGRLQRITYALGTTDEASSSYEYDAAGNTTATIDELGHRSEFAYDELNRVTRRTEADPDGPGPLSSPVTSYEYDSHGNLVTVIDPLGNVDRYAYDAQHRQVKWIDSDNRETLYAYDELGNMTSMTDRLGRQSLYIHDDRNRLVRTVNAAGGRITFYYDDDDNVVRTIDENGNSTLFRYDARNRLRHMIDARGGVTTTEYDAEDNITAVTDELGRRTEFRYDALNRLVSTTLPDPDKNGPATAPTYTYEYDAASNRRFTTDPLGNITELVYDQRDRLVRRIEHDPDGPGPLASPITEFAYDDANRLVSIADPLHRVSTFQYDDLNRLVVQQLPDPDGPGPDSAATFTHTYDAAGNQRSMTDPLGNTTQYGYDDLYRLTAITEPDPDGPGPLLSPVTIMAYDPAGQLTAISDPLSRVTAFEYDLLGRLTTKTQPDPDRAGPDAAPVTIYTYDPIGNKLSLTDPLGNVTRYAYDQLHRLTTVIEPDPDGPAGPATNPITRLTYDAADQLLSTVDALGREYQYSYDELGRPVRELRPDPDGAGPSPAPATTYEYDAVSRLLSTTDALGNVTRFEYDNLYRRTRVILEDPDGPGPQANPTTDFSYDIASQLISVTDPLARRTQFQYDDLGRVIGELYPDPDGAGPLAAPALTYAYDLVGNQLAMADAVGNTTQYVYDNLYRRTSMIEADPDGGGPLESPVSTYSYDVASQLLTVSDPLQRTETYEYDDLGRLVRMLEPDPDGPGPLLAPETTYVYDLVNNELSMTDPLGHVTQYEYDNLYRLVRRIDEDLDGPGPLSHPTTRFRYDAVDNLLSLTDPVGNATTYSYDALDRQTAETIELGAGNFKSRHFEYDLEDNLTRSTDRNGREIEYAYDDIYRLVEERWLDATGQTVHTIEFQFDEADQLLRAEDVTMGSRYDYSYDDLSRMLERVANNGGPEIIFTSQYDAQSRRTVHTANVNGVGDFQNNYFYDGLNRLARFEQTGQAGGAAVADKRFQFGYNANDQFTNLSRFDDLAGGGSNLVVDTLYGYDGIGRLTDMTHSGPSSTVVDYDWSFDAASRITQLVSSVDGVTGYTYDNVDQLTAATHAVQADEDYTFDENGNRTAAGYSTGFHNRLATDGTYSYQYDAEGNRTQRTDLTTGEVTQSTWDHRNRLVSVTTRVVEAGPITRQVHYRYDVFNRWISEEVDADGDGPAPAELARYEYDGGQIVLALDGAGNVTNRYSWGPAVDLLLADEQVGDQVLWPLADHLGTIRDLVDSSGLVVNHLTYDSFGIITGETNAAIDELFAYAGRPLSLATGLQNHWHRWYDTATGGWISEDPIAFGGGDENLYRYVGNSPLNFVDPTGHTASEFGTGFTRGVGIGLQNWARENLNDAKTAIKALDVSIDAVGITLGGLYGGMGNVIDNLSAGIIPGLPGSDAAWSAAQQMYLDNPAIQQIDAITVAAIDALKTMDAAEALGFVEQLAKAAGDAAKDWLDELKTLFDKGCHEQLGERLGTIVGELLPEVLAGLGAGAARKIGKDGLKTAFKSFVKDQRDSIPVKDLFAATARKIAKSRVFRNIDDFAAGRTFRNDVVKQKAWEVYKRAAESKGIVIGFGDDVVKHGAKDGMDILAFSEKALGLEGNDWWEINRAWIDGAVDRGVPVKLVSRGDEVADALAFALESGRDSGLTREMRHLLMRGHDFSEAN